MCENGSGPEARRDPAAQAGPSRWTLVAIRRWRNPLLKPGVRPGFQSKQAKKERPSLRTVFPMSALCARREFRSLRRAIIFFILVGFPSREIGKIKRGFRPLRRATQGSALRTRSLSRKAGETFSDWCGAEVYKNSSFSFRPSHTADSFCVKPANIAGFNVRVCCGQTFTQRIQEIQCS